MPRSSRIRSKWQLVASVPANELRCLGWCLVKLCAWFVLVELLCAAWWGLMVLGGTPRCLVVFGGARWCLVVLSGAWWSLVVLVVLGGAWRCCVCGSCRLMLLGAA